MKRSSVILLTFIAAGALASCVFYVRDELRTPGRTPEESLILQVPRGLGAREVIELLEKRGVIRNRYVALGYLFSTRTHNKLRAGEYLFDRPMTIPEVVNKLTTGAVYLHKFTVPEGLTVKETAEKWQEQAFGSSEEFLKAAAGAVDLVQRLDGTATSVEGYLFPETYSFPTGTTARQVIESMVNRFGQMVDRLQESVPATKWPRNLHDTITLASLIETEAAAADERALIASVFHNRLARNILLQCDPTVIYALEQANQYRGTLTLADLKFRSPYNTYVNAGLPPGPIASPGYLSLVAAVQPAVTKYLYFVRTAEGRHNFSETLADHNRAVAAYRRMLRSKPSPTGKGLARKERP